jgi:Flp pilus assembly protein TadD
MGTSFGQQGKLSEAEAQFAEAVRLKPDSVHAIKEYGKILGLRGRLSEAETQYAKVLRLQPNDVESRKALAGFARIRREFRIP